MPAYNANGLDGVGMICVCDDKCLSAGVVVWMRYGGVACAVLREGCALIELEVIGPWALRGGGTLGQDFAVHPVVSMITQ